MEYLTKKNLKKKKTPKKSNKKKGRKKKMEKQKTGNKWKKKKMAGINPNLSAITLNVKDLNIPIKRIVERNVP